MDTLRFTTGDAVLETICSADERMALLVRAVGGYELELAKDYFPALVRSIIGQQLSVTVARTIWQRTQNLCAEVTPEVVVRLADEELKAAGLSGTKARYIKDLSQKVLSGELDLARLDALPDAEIIRQLLQVKGIGVWTAEMFLIFSLGRLDILSLGDLGLKRSIQWLYGYKKTPAERTMKILAKKWAPYRTVASLYLWEVINRGLIKESPEVLNIKFEE